MDRRLVAWGHQVKARYPGEPPPLWLFTDRVRLPDTLAAVAALPAGLCGVVFRDEADPGLLRRVARLCRARRLWLSVAGGTAPPPGAGRHLREGRGRAGAARWTTSSAHGPAGLHRARGATVVFLSPVFPTASHPGAPALGPLRWAAMARGRRAIVAALGGVDGESIGRLPRSVRYAGAIGALGPDGSMSPLGHSVSRLPCQASVHDCEVKKGTAILHSGLADPEPLLPRAAVE